MSVIESCLRIHSAQPSFHDMLYYSYILLSYLGGGYNYDSTANQRQTTAERPSNRRRIEVLPAFYHLFYGE